MPPKAAKNEPKKSKKQRALEKKKQREEEEARLQAEREEEERLERQRKEEELERLMLNYMERKDNELDELHHLLENNCTALTAWRINAAETAEWEKYLRFDCTPEPKQQKQINTFISLWRDDPVVNITEELKQCSVAVQLVEELEDLRKEATDPKEVQKYQEGMEDLQELIHAKHLLIAEVILKGASKNLEPRTENMQKVIQHDQITLCLWTNVQKDLTSTSLNFAKVGLGLELPVQLALSSIGVRILHTRYDHLSMQARMSHRAESQAPSKEGEPSEGAEVNKSSRKSSFQPSIEERSQILTQMDALTEETSNLEPLNTSTEDLIGPQPPSADDGAQIVDVMQYTALGGVFHLDLFELPPQPCKAGNWMFTFISRGSKAFPSYNQKSSLGDPEASTRPPFGISVTLQDWLVVLESPLVACWDAAGKQWRQDGISNVSYEAAKSKISFNIETIQTFALMQRTYVNFPFAGWELRPLGHNSALLTVKGALVNVSVSVQDNECMLQMEQDRSASHPLGKWMSLSALQKAMLNIGINIFSNETTHRYVGTLDKDLHTEHAAYRQMALFASACAFSWSRWNSSCGSEQLVLQACEHLERSPVPEDSWSSFLLGAQFCKKLETNENSDSFSGDYDPGSEFHATFIHMLQDFMSSEGKEMAQTSDILFIETVQNLLWATRPLLY